MSWGFQLYYEDISQGKYYLEEQYMLLNGEMI